MEKMIEIKEDYYKELIATKTLYDILVRRLIEAMDLDAIKVKGESYYFPKFNTTEVGIALHFVEDEKFDQRVAELKVRKEYYDNMGTDKES